MSESDGFFAFCTCCSFQSMTALSVDVDGLQDVTGDGTSTGSMMAAGVVLLTAGCSGVIWGLTGKRTTAADIFLCSTIGAGGSIGATNEHGWMQLEDVGPNCR